jgi:ubiquitin thioesterase protein OTUB1
MASSGGASDPSLLEQALNYDEATMAQVERIQKEIAESAPLVGEREDLTCLEAEYAKEDSIYQAKIQNLRSRYSQLRRTRGDGNCFFRAFAFGYMESLLHDKSDLSRFRDAVNKQKSDLLALGYPTFTLDDFHDNFMETLEEVANPATTIQSLTEKFRDQGCSDYVVCYLRILTSGHLQTNSQFFQAFVEGGKTMKEYCSQEVEPMYHECDHMHITALTAALGVPVRVEYMDRGEGGVVNHHDFPEEGSQPVIHILYRPSHYDILYR